MYSVIVDSPTGEPERFRAEVVEYVGEGNVVRLHEPTRPDSDEELPDGLDFPMQKVHRVER